jgi:UDP-glucose:(heptosyl)LPS alpha-1,3-glucosyltransferase
MRLAILYHQFIRAGGLEGYLIEWCRQMQRVGHTLEIVTTRTQADVQEQLPGAQWHTLPASPSALLRMARFNYKAPRLARTLGADLSVGFGRTTTHDTHRAGGGCHRLYSALLPWYKRYSPKNVLELLLERRLYSGEGTRQFVTNSHRVSAQLQGLYPASRSKCRVIHTAVDTTYFKPSEQRSALRQRYCQQNQSDPQKTICLFVSLSHRRKGLDALLAAWQHLDAVLWIVGRPLDARYTALVHQHGLEGRVRVLPQTHDLREIYQSADWFVHPTLYDACANTVLQSMASGLPGIISAQDGAIDHIQHEKNGLALYHPTRVDELASRLTQAIYMHPAQRQSMAEAARYTMLPLTWPTHVKGWQELFAELKPQHTLPSSR